MCVLLHSSFIPFAYFDLINEIILTIFQSLDQTKLISYNFM